MAQKGTNMADFSKPGTTYFDVDGVIVRVVCDDKTCRGIVVSTGASYPPAKALVDGREITRKEAETITTGSNHPQV